MSTNSSAVGLGLTAQSAKSNVESPESVGALRSMMKVEEASLMPLAVPTQWKALRSISPVEAMEPATMPCARSSATIMLPK